MTLLRGIWSAAITPLTPAFAPDTARAVTYYQSLLDDGCDGINLLGTGGEAMSFSVDQRVNVMRAVAALDTSRFMVGTGACALEDAVALTRAAHELHFTGALVMPPFFYRNVERDGIVRWFDELFARTADRPIPVLLYHFPAMSGIAFDLELVRVLVERYGSRIAGIKDSSNDRELQRAWIRAFPHLAVFPASESYLLDALDDGVAGCISGSVALWCAEAARAFAHGDADAAARIAAERNAIVARGGALSARVREEVARRLRDDAWLRAMPPL